MKKRFIYYAILWVILLALFNVIAFVAPGWENHDKFTGGFWAGYVLITLMLIGQLICGWIALKDDNSQKVFYKISLVRINYAGLIVSFIVGGLCMLISPPPYWVGIIVCAIVLVATVLPLIKAAAAVEEVEQIDKKIKVQTFFIKSLTVDADTLMARAKSEEIKAECRKVYEAIRYSDPMSDDALASAESQITLAFAKLTEAVEADNAETVKETAREVIILVNDRNKKCKLLK